MERTGKHPGREIGFQIASTLIGLAASYATAKLYGLLPDDEDPVLDLYRRCRAALQGFREGRDEVYLTAAQVSSLHRRVRELLEHPTENEED